MIKVIDVNAQGIITAERDLDDRQVTLATDDRIYLRPDWPPIGSPDFAARLRAWYAERDRVIVISR